MPIKQGTNSIIHSAASANLTAFTYTQVYASAVLSPTINGVVVPMVAGGVMVATVIWLLDDMSLWLTWSFSQRVLTLVYLIAAGAGSYLLTVLLLGLRLKDLKVGTD